MNQDFDEILNLIVSDIELFYNKLDNNNRILNIRGVHGETLLHYCAVEGMADTVRELIKMGFSVNTRSKYDSTPLMDAALNGHVEVVKILMVAGADPALKDHMEDTVIDKLKLLGRQQQMIQLIEDASRNRAG